MTCDICLDKAKVRRSFAAAAASYDSMAELQRRVGFELMQRFPLGGRPDLLLDIGCGTGFLSNLLSANIAGHDLIALDWALPMLQTSRRSYPQMAAHYVCADAENLPFANQSVAQIYSNLALQWTQDLPKTLIGFKRILKPEGQLVFSTFGPETLWELKSAWAEVDSFTHVNSFHGVAEIEEFLQVAGFQKIYLDNVVYKVRYPSVQSLMRELKGIGAHNVNYGRNPKPTTKSQLQQMIDSYEAQMSDNQIIASYEIIFVKAESW